MQPIAHVILPQQMLQQMHPPFLPQPQMPMQHPHATMQQHAHAPMNHAHHASLQQAQQHPPMYHAPIQQHAPHAPIQPMQQHPHSTMQHLPAPMQQNVHAPMHAQDALQNGGDLLAVLQQVASGQITVDAASRLMPMLAGSTSQVPHWLVVSVRAREGRGRGVERTSAEPRLRRPGRRITFLECSRRLWHGYSWGVEAYLRAAPPHCSRDTLNNSHQYTFRGSTDHHPSPCVLRSRGLAVPLLRPLQCAFYAPLPPVVPLVVAVVGPGAWGAV